MFRAHNFGVGPACLPLPVIEQIREEMFDFKGKGMSIIEMSHRSPEFEEIISESEQLMRELMDIPDDYAVIFMQGGASAQFALIPMNLMAEKKKAYYLDTGVWAGKAVKEAGRFGNAEVFASGKQWNYTVIPDYGFRLEEDADYVHITSNNTTYCTRLSYLPDAGSMPICADMSSCILSERINVSDYGLIYASAQKNLGPAGVTAVIIRKDLLGRNANIPAIMNYAVHAENGSLYNTAPVFSVYVMDLVLKWIKDSGGVIEMEKRNKAKAVALYKCINDSWLFDCPIASGDRSMMNVSFVTGKPEIDDMFIEEAAKEDIVGIRANPCLGGMRASIYNAVSMNDVEALISFMRYFEKTH